ncbi:DNA ligase [Wohlfahrtiimonas chitiniclastica]|uniref:DNA ligase n=1 Tax=Wohlfahrtiimonas chitiniclastica TaxID=400946 RepID=UPI000B998311|nr:DNA ligase [Wohlfahrtiimonas chitiniclastica]OYQ78820.1 DNA ligase [Wohlfahrtiimonas chitiniclastica]
MNRSLFSQFLFSLLIVFANVIFAVQPLQHGQYYQDDMEIDLANYYVSEKLDGFRGYWDGQTLKSKTGYAYQAPDWFTEALGTEPLDGELWMGRGRFDELASVLNGTSNPEGWRNIQYMIFDLPSMQAPFHERVIKMREYIPTLNAPHVHMIEQEKVDSKDALMQRLKEVVAKGGEGLMLHHQDALYGVGRVNHLLKVKPYDEGKGIIVGYKPGKGKYTGLVGSLRVKLNDGSEIYVGSGLTDELRAHPPAIGTTIAFVHNGWTKHGKPRFARFKRVRNSAME